MDLDDRNKENFYDLFVDKDKAFFAVYFNIAQRNLLNVFCNIGKVLGGKEFNTAEENLHDQSQNPLLQILMSENKEEEKQTIIRLLELWLPSVVVGIKMPKDIGTRLRLFARLINDYRNYYSHYCQRDGLPSGAEVKSVLETMLMKRAKERLCERYSQLNDSESITFKDLGAKIDGYMHMNSQGLTSPQCLFFLFLFLQRSECNEVLNHITGFKRTDSGIYKYNREYFQSYCCKLPQLKMTSGDAKAAIILDVLNELDRCPSLLYEYLKEEDQKSLQVCVFDNDVVLKRHADRSSYFYLKMLELSGAYPALKFHINLGEKYLKEPYVKKLFGEERPRVLTQDILTFGSLHDYDVTTYANWIKDDKYVFPLKNFKPHYHMNNNVIGLRIATKSCIPNLENSAKKEEEKAEYFMSVHDLPHLAYLYALGVSEREITGKVLSAYKSNYNKFLDAVKNGLMLSHEEKLNDLLAQYGLSISAVTTRLKNALLGNQLDCETAVRRKLQKQIDTTAYLIDNFEKDPQVRDKNHAGFFHFSFKKGDLADWLARDMVQCMRTYNHTKNETVHCMKINSSAFQMLQGKLAFFSENKTQLEAMYVALGILDKHPFLKQVSIADVNVKGRTYSIGLKKYFKNYLGERSAWLREELKSLSDCASVDELKERYYYLPLSTGRYSAQLDHYIEDLKSKPIYLPRGVFFNILKGKLGLEDGQNVSYYLGMQYQEEKQWFYQADLDTRVLNLTEKEKAEFDKKVRFVWHKDLMLWKMLLKFADSQGELGTALRNRTLSAFSAFEEGDYLLNQSVNVSVEVKSVGDTSYTIRSFRKIKDYGALRRYAKDKRLPQLLEYLDSKSIYSMEDLIAALDLYERERHAIIDRFLNFEKRVSNDYSTFFENAIDVKYGYVAFFKLLELWNVDVVQSGIINDIRNAVLHNQCFKLDSACISCNTNPQQVMRDLILQVKKELEFFEEDYFSNQKNEIL